MLSSQIPEKFPVPWANSAGSGWIRPIPIASQILTNPGAASVADGFVPLNGTPIAAGGIPPSEADMNGILNWITLWDQWNGAGGPVFYDASFSASIGGYPKGAEISSAAGDGWWVSTAENNVTDPDTGGAGWLKVYNNPVAVASFTGINQSLTANGYQKLPGGLIMQWGHTNPVPSGSTGLIVAFPIAFTTLCFSVVATYENQAGAGSSIPCNIAGFTNTNFLITQQGGTSIQFFWQAFGQ